MGILKDTYHVLQVDDEENNLNSFKAAFVKNYNAYTAFSARKEWTFLQPTISYCCDRVNMFSERKTEGKNVIYTDVKCMKRLVSLFFEKYLTCFFGI